jgi:Undecaprenyl-phosphate glucose phosphotransferase
MPRARSVQHGPCRRFFPHDGDVRGAGIEAASHGMSFARFRDGRSAAADLPRFDSFSFRPEAVMAFHRDFVSAPRQPRQQPDDIRAGWAQWSPWQNTALVRATFGFVAALIDACAILASAITAGLLYHKMFYAIDGMFDAFFDQGMAITALFLVPSAMRHDYTLSRYLARKGRFERCFGAWNVAFISALTLAFMAKTSADVSRGTVIVFYFLGITAVCGGRVLLGLIVQKHAQSGAVAVQRVYLVGFEEDIRRFTERYQPQSLGMRIVAASVLRGQDSLEDDLALAAASARMLKPDDVFILVPWSQKETIDACVNAFLRMPAAIHLGPERVLDRFTDIEIERHGPIASLNLVRRALSMPEIVAKRLFDFVVAGAALLLLAPCFAIIALLIKLDSPGPVFFLQRRYGFNQEPFRIWKFRSMSVLEDDFNLRQAGVNDVRVTRIGAILRRTNIDELPQLFNVVRGEMSLVGPRPHALVHDQQFERAIALYARRHNVKPGITGWAQVNGLRGETSTTDKMAKRVEHDLYYIDHWSMWFDIRILLLTLFSRKAYRNAG